MNPIDRSLAFTALLNRVPAFGKLESRAGSKVITDMLDAYYQAGGYAKCGTLYDYAPVWWAVHMDATVPHDGADDQAYQAQRLAGQ